MFTVIRENNVVGKSPTVKKALPNRATTGVNSSFVLKKLSDLFIIIGFTIFIGGGVQLFVMLRGAEGFSTLEGDLPSQIIYFLVYVATCFFLILSRRRILLGIIRNFWFWLLVFWTCASVVWSGAPWVTTRQVIAICGTTLFSIYLVNTLEMQKYIKLLAISLLVINISSYLFIVFLPAIGIGHVVSDEWKGIFTHKNHLGKAASLSILVFIYLLLTVRKRKWIWLLGFFSAVGLVAGSQSAAAMAISIFIVMVIIVFYLAKKIPILLWISVIGLIISITLIPLPSVEQVLGYFGKDETLTGRTPLWDFCIFMAQRKPLLGYGYGAFWLGSEGPSAEVWSTVYMGADSNHCHNGFLDLVLAIGGVGFVIFFIACWTTIKRSSKFLFNRRFGFQDSIYLILLLWILLYNISEQALLYRNSIFWVIFSSVILYQSKTTIEEHRE